MLSLEDCIALSGLTIKSMIRDDIQMVLRNDVSERRRLD
jgi:hypothetical protein